MGKRDYIVLITKCFFMITHVSNHKNSRTDQGNELFEYNKKYKQYE
jgi:hypothetical protein